MVMKLISTLITSTLNVIPQVATRHSHRMIQVIFVVKGHNIKTRT